MVLTGETELLGENLPRRHFVHHKSHLPDLGTKPGLHGRKPGTNHFSYGVATISLRHVYYSRTFLLVNALRLVMQK
jgi:hypothetical protein